MHRFVFLSLSVFAFGCALNRSPIVDDPGMDAGMRDTGGIGVDTGGLDPDVPPADDTPRVEDSPSCPETCPSGESCAVGTECRCDVPMCEPFGECVDGHCAPCGHLGEPCCGGVAMMCRAGGMCDAGTCIPTTASCGMRDEPCCGGTTCMNGMDQCIGGTCIRDATCGGAGAACCGGSTCITGYQCQWGLDFAMRCRPCGGDREGCCPFGPACEGGLSCMTGAFGIRYCGS